VLTPNHVDLSFWQDILHALGTLTRPHFLETVPDLVPLILHFGGEVALREVYQGIRDVIPNPFYLAGDHLFIPFLLNPPASCLLPPA